MVKFLEAADNAFTSGASVGAFKGSVKNLSNQVYHSLKSYWSSSDLKFMASSSPQHFQNHYMKTDREGRQILIPDRLQKPPTWEMILGSLVHCLILTPLEFEKDFFIMPDLNLRTNEGKAAKEKLLYENQGKFPIDDEMLAQANAMREAAFKIPRVRALLEPGLKEAAYFWECPFSGLNFKAKLDQSSSQHFVELKTTSKAGPDHFSRHLDNMNYDLSLFHYQTAMKQTIDLSPPAYFIVIEQEAPHVTQVYKANESCWQTGHAKWLDAVTKLEAGIKKMQWPGYFPLDMEMEIGPPPWALNKLMKGETNGI